MEGVDGALCVVWKRPDGVTVEIQVYPRIRPCLTLSGLRELLGTKPEVLNERL